MLLVGGNANNTTNAGLAYSNVNNVPSNPNSNIGSRLNFHKKNKRDKDRASWQKITTQNGCWYRKRRFPIMKAKMKRVGNLYEKIYSIENLLLADKKARRGKSKSYGIIKHDQNREQNILDLSEALKNKTFRTSKYHIFKIYEPKEREIYQLRYFPDRIVHHAVVNVLEPIWTLLFTRDTYSSIKGRGIHGVFRKLKEDLKDINGTKYCLKFDIQKYYPSIDHNILKTLIRKKIKDKDLLWLLDNIIDSARGVPIGNYLSQFFANIYLSYFDHWIKEEKHVKYYYRYADDIVILSDDKNELHRIFEEIDVYLKNNLNLIIKKNYQIFPVEKRGIDFIGYVFFNTHIFMRKEIKKRFIRAIKKRGIYNKHLHSSYYGWAVHCNSRNLLKKLEYEYI